MTSSTDSATSSQAPVVTGEPAGFNAADVAFATHMIPHHQQAVRLSALVPERSTDPAVVDLAAAISAAQEPEIQTMKALLVQWTESSNPDGGSAGQGNEGGGNDAGGKDAMQGMVDDQTMARLKSLTGTDFDMLWLQSMIGHHEGAIAMANAEIADGANVDGKNLAQQIVTAQQAEVDQMKQMLGG